MIKKFLKNIGYMFSEILEKRFEVIYSIYFVTMFLDTTSVNVDYPLIDMIARIMRYMFYVLFLIRIISKLPEYWKDISIKNWKRKAFVEKFTISLAVVLAISTFINFIITHNNRIILLLLVLLASYKTDYKKIIKSTMIMQIIMTSIITLMSVLGFTQNYVIYRPSNELRHSLGFTYPTNLSQLVLFSSLLYLFYKKFNVSFITIYIMQLINNVIYFLTDSKSEFIFLEFIIIITILYKFNVINKLKTFCKKILTFFAYTFPLYPIISLCMVLLYPQGKIFEKINYYLSNRLRQPYGVIRKNGITLFGDNVKFVGYSLEEFLMYGNTYTSNVIDNEYIQMLIKEGLIITIIFIIILNILLIILSKQKKYYELFLCSIYLMFGIINPRIISIIYCPILFIIIPTFTEYFSKYSKFDSIKKKGTHN